VDVTATDGDAARTDDESFSAVEVGRTDRATVACGYFGPGQAIPVTAPSSDVVETAVPRGVGADSSSKLEASSSPTHCPRTTSTTRYAKDEFDPRNA
jgi:hypothetical protein